MVGVLVDFEKKKPKVGNLGDSSDILEKIDICKAYQI
jgi:hypothetical protein